MKQIVTVFVLAVPGWLYLLLKGQPILDNAGPGAIQATVTVFLITMCVIPTMMLFWLANQPRRPD
jgi:hypothetical protein